jgi:YbbR domain-containing protein
MKKEPALFTSLQRASMDKGRSKFFLFFLVFSFILWFIAKFSKEYTEVISLEMTFENVPPTIIPIVKSPTNVEFTLKATGFQFLYYQFLDNRLKINAQEADFDSGRAELPIAAQYQNLKEQLLGDTEIINYFPAVIEFDFQEQTSQKIPVISPEFKIALGYSAVSIQFVPDSIDLIGPMNQINAIKEVQPLFTIDVPIEESFETMIALPDMGELISLSNQRVLMKVVIDRFSEAKYQLPIKMINAPQEGVFKFFPTNVSITLSAPLNSLRDITPEDFQVGIDYNQLSANNKSVKLKVYSAPKGVTNMRLEPKEVQYLKRQ